MLCKRCMVVMTTGTRYEQKKGQNKPSHKKYYKCNKCHDYHEILEKEFLKK